MRIPHSSAIVKGIAEGTIEWEVDPDFGYQVAAARARGSTTADLDLPPAAAALRRAGARDEYDRCVARLKAERAEYLPEYASLSAEIVESVK